MTPNEVAAHPVLAKLRTEASETQYTVILGIHFPSQADGSEVESLVTVAHYTVSEFALIPLLPC